MLICIFDIAMIPTQGNGTEIDGGKNLRDYLSSTAINV